MTTRSSWRRVTLASVFTLAFLTVTADWAVARCAPQSLNRWRSRCLTDRDDIRDALATARRTATFSDLDSVGEACRVLAATGGACGRARAELLTTLLNLGHGRLEADCVVDTGDGETRTVGELVRRADAALDGSPEEETCQRVARALSAVNDGSALTGDRGGGHDPDGDDDGHDHGGDDRDRGTVEHDGHHHGKGPSKGRGHREHGRGHGYGHEKHHGDDHNDHGRGDHDPDDGDDDARCCDPWSASRWERACQEGDRRDRLGDACEALVADSDRPCARAERQLAALRLNLRSGRLDADCRLNNGRTADEMRRRIRRLIEDGDCEEALRRARALNTGASLAEPRPCDRDDGRDRDRRRGHRHGDEDDDDDDGEDDDEDDRPRRGRGKGRGRPH